MGKWSQVIDANWKIPYVGGWCEGYVEGAWGKATLPTINNQQTSGVYASATDAWNKSQGRHTDYPPAGITVPVFFSLGSTPLGHVAIRLDDLMVASSTQGGFHTQGYIHPNIANLISVYAQYNGGCQYLGWSEFVGGTRVVKYVPDVITKDITTTSVVPFESLTKEDSSILKGETKVATVGVNGVKTTITTVTYTDGVETGRVIKSQTITTAPINQLTLIGTKEISTDSPLDVENNNLLKQILALLQKLSDKFFSIFK